MTIPHVYVDTNFLIDVKEYLEAKAAAGYVPPDLEKRGAVACAMLDDCARNRWPVSTLQLTLIEMLSLSQEWTAYEFGIQNRVPRNLLFGREAAAILDNFTPDELRKIGMSLDEWMGRGPYRYVVQLHPSDPRDFDKWTNRWWAVARLLLDFAPIQPMDALHVAGAMVLGCDFFATRDNRLAKIIGNAFSGTWAKEFQEQAGQLLGVTVPLAPMKPSQRIVMKKNNPVLETRPSNT